jgi:hypothetical protein
MSLFSFCFARSSASEAGGLSPKVCRPRPRQAERDVYVDERRRMVDSRREPRTYASAAAAQARCTPAWAIGGSASMQSASKAGPPRVRSSRSRSTSSRAGTVARLLSERIEVLRLSAEIASRPGDARREAAQGSSPRSGGDDPARAGRGARQGPGARRAAEAIATANMTEQAERRTLKQLRHYERMPEAAAELKKNSHTDVDKYHLPLRRGGQSKSRCSVTDASKPSEISFPLGWPGTFRAFIGSA